MRHHFVFVTFVQWNTKIQLHTMFCIYWNNYIYENSHKHNQKIWMLAKCPPCKYWLKDHWVFTIRWLAVWSRKFVMADALKSHLMICLLWFISMLNWTRSYYMKVLCVCVRLYIIQFCVSLAICLYLRWTGPFI